MTRFSFEGMAFALVVILLGSVGGTFGPAIAGQVVHVITLVEMTQLLVVAGTAVAVGAMFGLKERLPNYGGLPPLSFLTTFLRPCALTGILASSSAFGIAMLLRATPELAAYRVFGLYTALILNVCVVGRCAWITYRAVDAYQCAYAWERTVHPIRK